MYLTKHIYVGANWEHNNVRGEINLTHGKENTPIKINLNKVSVIIEDAGYWRKANHIHRWFVENVQDGEDDCGEYYVERDKLQELLDICNEILKNVELVDGDITNGYRYTENGKEPIIEKGKVVKSDSLLRELLPTTSGFFFGGTEYDEYYIRDVEDTVKILEEALADDSGDYYYHSSW